MRQLEIELIDGHRFLLNVITAGFMKDARKGCYDEDVELEAVLAFLECLRKYNPDRGPLDKFANEKVKTGLHEFIRKFTEPWLTSREWAGQFHIKKLSPFTPVDEIVYRTNLREDQVLRILHPKHLSSIDSKSELDGRSIAETIAADRDLLGEVTEEFLTQEQHRDMVSSLDAMELFVHINRTCEHQASFDEIGDLMGVSREWVRRRDISGTKKITAWMEGYRSESGGGPDHAESAVPDADRDQLPVSSRTGRRRRRVAKKQP